MAVKQTGRFASEADYLKTLAKTSDLFNQSTYADMVAQGRGAEYSAAIYGTKDKTSDTFDFGSYNLLSGADQYAYVVNEFYVDRNEYKTDDKTGERYNVYERNKAYLDYQIDEQIKENIYNSLNGWEKFIYSVGGFVGDIVSTVYSVGEGVIDAVLFLSEGIGRLGEALGSGVMGDAADEIRKWASYDTTRARAFQAAMEDFTKKYTVWDKTAFTSTVREVYTSIAKMAPLLIPGAGGVIYYGSMAGDLYNQTIQANPDIDYGKLFAYTAGSVGLEALVEWSSAKIFGGDTISKAIGFKGEGGLDGLITSKLAGKPAAMFFAKTGLNMFTEGLEEGVTEIFGTLLEQATVDPNANLTIQDVLHSALVGAITGGIMTGGSILGTKNLVIDSKTGDFMVDDNGKYVTWNKLTKEQKQTLGKQAKVGKMNTIAFKESLASYADSLNNVSEVTKLKNKYNENITDLRKNHAVEYIKAVEKDTETYKQQGMNALKLAALMETIGVSDFKKAVETLQNANDKAIDLIDKYLNKRNGATAHLQAVQKRFEEDNPGVNISFKETLTNEERRIKNAIKAAYGTDVYFVDFGANNGLNPGTFKRGVNEIFINSENVKNMSYQKLLESVIKQELVNATTNGGIITQTDFRKLLGTILPDGTEITDITDDIKTMMVQKLLFEDITVSKVFDTNKNLFTKLARFFNKLKKENRMARKDDANKIEFNQLLKIRQRYVDAVAKAIGNEIDLLQAKIVMELSDDEVEHIKNTYTQDATNEHIILMKKNFTRDASDKRNVERMLIQNRLGDKRLKLDYSQIYNPEYYKDEFVKTVLDSYPGLLFKDALWYYVSDNTGYSISQAEGMLYKQANLVAETNPEFSTAYASALKNKDKKTLAKFDTIDKILNPTFLKSFDKTGVAKVKVEYVDVMKPAGRTIINPDGSIVIQINTDANHLNDGLLYSIYHEISHALGYVQGFPFGTSPKIAEQTLRQQKPALVRNLGVMMFGGDYVESVSYDALIKELSYEIYRQSQGERYASGERESFVQDADGFDVVEHKIIGKGKYAKIAGIPLVMDFTGYTYTVAESAPSDDIAGARFVKETNITDLAKEGFSQSFIQDFQDGKLSKTALWAHLKESTVGNTNATNKLIDWLTSGQNKRMKTIDNVMDVINKRIGFVLIYYGYRWNSKKRQFVKDANAYPSTKKMSEIMTTLKEQRENQREYNKMIKGTDKKPVAPLLTQAQGDIVNGVPGYNDYFMEQLADADKDTDIIKYLIEHDFNYSEQDVAALVKWMSSRKQTTVEKKETKDVRSDGESDYALSDAVQLKKYEEQELEEITSYNEEADKEVESAIYGDSDTLEDLKNKLKEINKKYYADSTFYDYSHILSTDAEKEFLIEKFGEDGFEELIELTKHSATQTIENLFTTGTLEDVLKNIREGFAGKENTFDNNTKDWLTHRKHPERKEMIKKRFGEAGYKQILKALPKRKADYNKDVKYYKDKIEKKTDATDVERRLYSVDTTNFKPSDFEEYISYLKNPETLTNPDEYFKDKTFTAPKAEQKEVVPVETAAKTKQEVRRELIEQTYNENAEEKINLSEAKRQGEYVYEIRYGEEVKQKQTELFNILPSDMIKSEYGGDYENPKTIQASGKLFEKHETFFANITNEEFLALYDLLNAESTTNIEAAIAANVLLRYAYNNRNTQFKEIGERIKLLNKIQANRSAGFMGGLNATYGGRSVRSFVKEVGAQYKTEIELPTELAEQAIEAVTGVKMSLEDYANQVEKEMKELKETRAKTKDPFDKLELDRQIIDKNKTLDALNEGNVSDIIDCAIDALENNDTNQLQNQEKIDALIKNVVEYVVKHTDVNAENKPVFRPKQGVLSPETQRKITDFLKGLDSFRYLCMLSSPLTWGKNALSNTLISVQAIVEDALLGRLEKSKFLDTDTQIRFVGEYDAEFAKYVDDKYVPWIKQQTQGDRYAESEMDKLRRTYAEEKDPIKKSKILSKWNELQSKMLQDSPWTSRRAKRNLKNELAGASVQIFNQSRDWLVSKYKGKFSKTEITDDQLYQNIKKTNSELAEMFKEAATGNPLSVLKLGEKLGVDLLDLNNPNSIPNHALYRGNKLLFRVDNGFSRMIKHYSRYGGAGAKAAIFTLKLLNPFVRATVNMTSYIIDRSPIGIVKGVVKALQTKSIYRYDMITNIENYYKSQYVKFKKQELKNQNKDVNTFKYKQNEFDEWAKQNVPSETQQALIDKKQHKQLKEIYDNMVNDGLIPPHAVGADDPYMRGSALELLSQGAVGTGTMVLGLILAAATGAFDYDDDDDYLGPVIKIGDLKISINDLSPFTTLFSMGAMLTSGNTDNGFLSALNVFIDNTMFSVIDSAITYSDGVIDFFGNQMINTVQQFIPASIKQLTKTVRNAKPDKTGSWGMKFLKTTASNLPLFNWLVPNKINPYTGDPVQNYNGGIFEQLLNLLSPIGVRYEPKTALEREAERLGVTTNGSSGVYTINDKEFKANKTETAKFRAKYLAHEFDEISNDNKKITVEDVNGKRITAYWSDLTDKQKEKVLSSLYSKASNVAKIEAWTSAGNNYIVTNRDDLKKYRDLITNKSNIIYKQSWNKSKFVEG